MSGRRPSDEELRQWHAAMRGVRPLSGTKPPTAPAPKPKSKVRTVGVTDGVKPPRAAPKKAPIDLGRPLDRSNERQIRRGQQTYDAVLDLHGHTQDSAWSLLPAFLTTAQSRGVRCVVVITGKGRGGEGVLRRNFLRWLEQGEAKHLVSGFAQAHPRHGGRGAWYVFLRRP